MARPTPTERKSVYEIISSQILASLEKGTIPWKRPWANRGGQRNVRGTAYRGINQFLLGAVALDKGYESPMWLTFNQARGLGGSVKRGEKGIPIVFWKRIAKQDKDATTGEDKEKSFFLLRYFTVFNIAQCDGVTVVQSAPPPPVEPIAECERIVATMPKAPKLQHLGDRACYSPPADTVTMPVRDAFSSSAHYYSTLFHELGHATGHTSRLARKGVSDIQAFGSHEYGQEELVAEFTAAFLCGTVGIAPQTVDTSAGYIEHWSKAIRADEKLVVVAAAQAQKAADFILGGAEKDEDEEREDG